jgi:hypothetical protein
LKIFLRDIFSLVSRFFPVQFELDMSPPPLSLTLHTQPFICQLGMIFSWLIQTFLF